MYLQYLISSVYILSRGWAVCLYILYKYPCRIAASQADTEVRARVWFLEWDLTLGIILPSRAVKSRHEIKTQQMSTKFS